MSKAYKSSKRCPWAEITELDQRYHDTEWGRPVRDDHRLFEMLTLEGAQAGLSWSTILSKREGYRKLFANFDPTKVSRYTPKKVEKLLHDPAIVRHRGKIESTISNAKCVIEIQTEYDSFAEFIWSFTKGKTIQNRFKNLREVPTETPVSKAMSKELKRRGFRFVGPTTCYAFMQAAGLVNDHLVNCPCYAECVKG